MTELRQTKHALHGKKVHGMRPFHCFLATILAIGASAAISQQPRVMAPVQPNAQQSGTTNQPRFDDANSRSAIQTAASFPSFGPQTGKTGPFDRAGAAGEMIGFTTSDGSGSQTITLVHTGKSWMAVYHVDRSGTIRLVSSRPIDADFSLQLNATSPLPREIRELVGKK